MAGLARDLATRFERLVTERNQFLRVAPEAQEQLAGLFHAYLRRVEAVLHAAAGPDEVRVGLDPVEAGHAARLGRFIATLWSGVPEAQGFAYREQVSAEYSAELQLRVLGVTVESLAEPVLDLGCGPRALLVGYLRQQGRRAFGLDRGVVDGPYLFAGDWLEADFGVRRWGSIISHLAFTNHFVLQHEGGGEAARYATVFLGLLEALERGGTFYYVPAVPFLEAHLPPERFAVHHHGVPGLEGSEDGPPPEAVHITRLD